jgi:hypothetical protein
LQIETEEGEPGETEDYRSVEMGETRVMNVERGKNL